MKAVLRSFIKTNVNINSSSICKIGGSENCIIYSIINMFGFYTVEVMGRNDTSKKRMIAYNLANPSTPINKKS